MMDAVVAVRQCNTYDPEELLKHIEWLYDEAEGPAPAGKKVLLKPNILSDSDPQKAITTHPAVVEAAIRFFQSRGAEVLVGDSPTFDNGKFTGEKCGIRQITEKCGAAWVRFNESSVVRQTGNSQVKVTSWIEEADILVSLPKMKNHELMYFTGAMKNIFGFVPDMNKALQHVKYPNRESLAEFFVFLEEAIRPHFHIMDGIIAMEGPGPANGYPKNVNLLLASANPLALDIVASGALGYDPVNIPVNRVALRHGKLLKSPSDIIVKGADPMLIKVEDFRRIKTGRVNGIIIRYLKNKAPLLRKLDKRPIFLSGTCISCEKCINICPVSALTFEKDVKNTVLIADRKCIRCYCCHEVCPEAAIEIRRKIFG
jgi:uncharacterized protein (DUF362 family)/Pyruvate/2-oxoacid:ferredoxin oxidoreductase delta subunit